MHYILLMGWLIGLFLFIRNKRTQKSKTSDILLYSLAIQFCTWLLVSPVIILHPSDSAYKFSLVTFFCTIIASALLASKVSKLKKDSLTPFVIFIPTLLHLILSEFLARIGWI